MYTVMNREAGFKTGLNTGSRRQIGNGIESAIEADWRKTVVRIKRLLLSMGVRMPDLEDLVQEVCIRVVGRKVRVNYKSWLRVLARNAVVDFYRKENRRSAGMGDEYIFDDRIFGVREDENNGDIASVQNPLKDLLEFDFKQAIEQELAGLETTQRQTMYLYAEGFEYVQIAALTDVPIGTVRSRIHYGKRKLRERLAAFR